MRVHGTRLRREGSEGSKGSACLWQAGSEGGGGGFAAGCVEGLRRYRSGGDSACGAEGGGLPSRAMFIKSALRDSLPVSYSMISILVISRYAAPPYPAAPDFLHGKACHTILRSLCSLTNRVPLPPHPGDRINRSMLSCRDMAPWLSVHSPTTKWGKVVAPATKGGLHVLARRAVVWFSDGRKPGCEGFIQNWRLLSIHRRPPPPFEPLDPFEPERRRRLNPQAPKGLVHKACQPSGILASTAQVPAPTAPQALVHTLPFSYIVN